jgi:hypothetical protein
MKNKILIKLICCYLLTVTFVLFLSLIISSNKYEDDISDLRIENKKLQHQLKTSYNTIADYKEKHPECEYYIYPSGDDFVIDGQLYEKVEGYEVYE